MPMPYLESPFPPPDASPAGQPGVGSVGAIAGARLDDPTRSAARAFRYWAAMSTIVRAPYGLALQMGAIAARRERPAAPVIPQTDTLELHRPAEPENPFENLVAHRLHEAETRP